MRTRLLLGILSAALLILTFPGASFTWLAPIALTPLLWAAAREDRWWRRFLIGELAGIVYWFGVCYWIQFVLSYHGGMGDVAGWAVFLLFCLGKALHMAVFTALAGPLMRRWYAVPAVAALWIGIERTHGPLGFAWMALGNAGIDMSLPMRLAPWVGVYGLSFVFTMLAVALALILMRRPRRELAWLAVLVVLFVLPPLPEPAQPDHTAVVTQPNIDMEQAWSAGFAHRMIDELSYRSMEATLDGNAPPDIIIWPEMPGPFYYERDPFFHRAADNLARLTRSYFLTGGVSFTQEGAPLNSAQLVSPAGQPVVRYDKIFLVPFGEFVPPLFDFVNKISQEAGNFAPGREVKIMPIHDHKAGTFICYEAVFPHLVRRFAARGAEVFFNISNDGYFGHSAARAQHLLIARMRSAENRRWIVRSTNNGFTVTIDPAGRIRQRLPADEEIAGRFGFSYVHETTFYTRHGDWFTWGCLVIGLLLAILGPGGLRDVIGRRLSRAG